MDFNIKDLLQIEVAPALGCTEPSAIALCAAAAMTLVPGKTIDSIELWVDPNIYKNGLAVSIPGAEGLKGLDMAAALGGYGGDPALKLEVLEPLARDDLAQAKKLVEQGRVKVNLLHDKRGLFIRVEIKSGQDRAEARIEGTHDNIVSLLLNGQEIPEHPLLSPKGEASASPLRQLEERLKTLSLIQLIELLDQLDAEDFVFLEQGVSYNMRLAEYGLKHGSGLGVGKTLDRLVRQRLLRKDMMLSARILTSAAADARMDGVKLPAMSSAGSGNHGLTAVLPLRAMQDYIEADSNDLLRAVALSHIVTAYVKAHTGRLSAVCGCSIAAGAGAAAGAAHMLGGDVRHIAGAIKNLTEDLAGVICDGAKAGCALKLATAAGSAVQAALFSLQGVNVMHTDGIIGLTPEKTMQNIGELSCKGMIETDRTILAIMLEKRISEFIE